MRSARVYINNNEAGFLRELKAGKKYVFEYLEKYSGPPVSVTLPIGQKYAFDEFPPFFEGLLPEGGNLSELLRTHKIDRYDLFSQLIAVGEDTVGAVTLEEIE